MKTCKHKTGVTLFEMLIVVAIVALLATMVITTATRIDNQAKEQLAESTIAILTTALGQFRDYGYNYPHPDYSAFDFPLDCNDFPRLNLENELAKALNATSISITGGIHKNEYSGSEALYFFLSRVPTSRKTLDKIDGSLITNLNDDGAKIEILIDGKVYSLLRITDPWGTTLRYSYYDGVVLRNFPVITSAGPDRTFGTTDDITSR